MSRPWAPIRLCLVTGACALLSGVSLTQAALPFTAQDLVSLRRLTDPQVSPDGKRVAYTLRETDLEADKGRTDLWLLDLGSPATPRRLTQHSANDSSARWSTDGQTLFFLSDRSGSSQIWRLALTGGEPIQVTNYPLDIGSFRVSPDGKHLAVTMEVFADCKDLGCTASRNESGEKSKARGRTYERMFVRHWDTWSSGARSHLFVAALVDGKAGTALDLSIALDADIPSKPHGDDADFTFSLDGARVVFSARAAGADEPWSTNFDLYEMPITGAGKPTNLTASNAAWDAQPVYLKNGDLAYLAMARAGYEADRFQIMVRNARSGSVRAVAQGWDSSVSHLSATADGRTLLASADAVGQVALFSIDPEKGTVRRISREGQVTEFSASGNAVVYAQASLAAPADLYVAKLGAAAATRLTSVNADILGQRALSPFEQFSFAGWNDEKVHGYVMKPHGFAPGRKFPLAFIIHGGPQAAFGNAWSFRWNPQTFAGRGYGVVFIEFHGSPGYGQAFTDSIRQDWGGKPLVDLQKGLEAALAKYSWLDGERTCALGASYGGFMVNWIAGQWPERFRCLVNHDGIFDQRMMYYSTEELWFPEWENGAPYFADPQAYEKFNPANHVTQWRTPMLVIHGEQDFRIPYDQGLATFTALQRRGIKSKLLIFPNENHWVLKPANSLQWYDTVLGWLDQHTKN